MSKEICPVCGRPCSPDELLLRRDGGLVHYTCHTGHVPDGTEPPEPEQPEPRLAGDMLHDTLAPAVEWIDHWLGTEMARCAGCEDRRAWLNRTHKAIRDRLSR